MKPVAVALLSATVLAGCGASTINTPRAKPPIRTSASGSVCSRYVGNFFPQCHQPQRPYEGHHLPSFAGAIIIR